MNRALIFIAAIVLFSCKSKLSHREKINLDSTGVKKILSVSRSDSTYGFDIDTGRVTKVARYFKPGDPDYPAWLIEFYIQTDSFRTYRQNGNWHVENPAASLEMIYRALKRSDSLNEQPFVIITQTDTFRIYNRADTVHVVSTDPAIKQL